MELVNLTKNELLLRCEELGIVRCKSKNKTELIKLINEKMLQNNDLSVVTDCDNDCDNDDTTMKDSFNLNEYYAKMEQIIKNILSTPTKEEYTYDILDTENTINNKQVVLKMKQYQMKIGDIWQKMIGNYDGFVDLGIGHETGLDVLSTTRKVIIEVKNRTNTDNHSSKESNLNKLAKFKQANPDYTCIYGNINSKTKGGTLRGSKKIILRDGIEIEQMVGITFLTFVFGENTDEIIVFLKSMINKYS